jgi:hypothetical protein
MFGFLRRIQPRNPVLVVLYWILLLVAALSGLFVLFFYLDNFLPGQGMF